MISPRERCGTATLACVTPGQPSRGNGMSQSVQGSKALRVDIENVPIALRSLDRWVVWKRTLREKGWTKVPYKPGHRRPIDFTDPANWSSFDAAVAAYSHDGAGWAGIGFVQDERDGIVGVDLDDVVSGGVIQAWSAAQRSAGKKWSSTAVDPSAVIDQLGTYAELSPSGRGLHAFCFATKPGDSCRSGDFEMYSRKRWLSISGHRVSDQADLIDSQDAVDSLYQMFLGNAIALVSPCRRRQGVREAIASLDDEVLIKRMFSSSCGQRITRLWRGDSSDFNGDRSAGDLALCSYLGWWTRKDQARMDRLFRMSGRLRDKWDERRGELTYGERTLRAAITGGGS